MVICASEPVDALAARLAALSVTERARPLSLFGNMRIATINAITTTAPNVASIHFFRSEGTKINTRIAAVTSIAAPDNHDERVKESINETKMPVMAMPEIILPVLFER